MNCQKMRPVCWVPYRFPMTSVRYGRPSLSFDGYPIAFHIEGRRRKMDGEDGSRLPWQYAFVASSCLDFIL